RSCSAGCAGGLLSDRARGAQQYRQTCAGWACRAPPAVQRSQPRAAYCRRRPWLRPGCHPGRTSWCWHHARTGDQHRCGVGRRQRAGCWDTHHAALACAAHDRDNAGMTKPDESGAHRIRVMIVDDHEMVRGGLAAFLHAAADLELAGEAETGEEAVQLCATVQPDVVLMDLMLPQMDGIAATRTIRQLYPRVQIIALTSFRDEHLIQGALQAGAIS